MSTQKSSTDATATAAAAHHAIFSWLQRLLPSKDAAKLSQWTEYLSEQEFESVEQLQSLSDAGWAALSLPLAVKDAMRLYFADSTSAASTASETSAPATEAVAPGSAAAAVGLAVAPPVLAESDAALITAEEAEAAAAAAAAKLVTQLDVILIDVSSSMKARSSIDHLKTREDMSKLLFHTMVDKLVGLELHHAVGLISFGAQITQIGRVTEEYERFHDELGRLDAREGSTKLYDSVWRACDLIETFAADNAALLVPRDQLKLRIFALTDGDDNSSQKRAWEVAARLQTAGIMLDAIPVADYNGPLQAMARASGGLYLSVSSEQQGCELFEREGTLHLAYREKLSAAEQLLVSTPIVDQAALRSLEKPDAIVRQVATVVPQVVLSGACLSTQQVTDMQNRTSAENAKSNASLKRVMREYTEFTRVAATDSHAPCQAFISASDVHTWKVIMRGPTGTLYERGHFLLSVQFPERQFPFSPPRVRFVTPVYHCNVSNDGKICLDVLKDAWSPALNITTVFKLIANMLEHPNYDDALDAFKADLFKTNHSRYVAEATAHTITHASDSVETLKQRFNIYS
jgi:ubiquitin-conjugating enzyme E2 D/E